MKDGCCIMFSTYAEIKLKDNRYDIFVHVYLHAIINLFSFHVFCLPNEDLYLYSKGVGEGGSGGMPPPPLSSGGHKWVLAPHFWTDHVF